MSRINPEYLRRNLLHCKAVGAHANTEAALKRLAAMKRPPKWIVAALEGIRDRVEPLQGALACYRSAAPRDLPSENEERNA